MHRPKWKRKYHGIGCSGWDRPASRRRERWITRWITRHMHELVKARAKILAQFPNLHVYC